MLHSIQSTNVSQNIVLSMTKSLRGSVEMAFWDGFGPRVVVGDPDSRSRFTKLAHI